MADSTNVSSLSDALFQSLLKSRIVILGSEVNDDVATKISAQLLLLQAENPDEDIKLYINSPGGSVTAGFAIYDTMQLISPNVATYAMGMAASMGQFLLTAGAPGKRYALPHARIMMHQPSAGIGGTAADIKIQAEVYGMWKNEISQLIAQMSGHDLETIIADSDRDRWFTASQAQEYGLVDHVITSVPHAAPQN